MEWFGNLIDWFYKNHLTGVSETHASIAIGVFCFVAFVVICGIVYGIWRLV